MREGIAKVAAIGVLAAVPAVALGSSTTYTGTGEHDLQAKIELKITDGDNRHVKKVIVKKLPYSGPFCTGSGRTPKATLTGDFLVKGDGDFRAVGLGDTDEPLGDGEIKVFGNATNSKVTGTMKFTFGKDGCRSDRLDFKATR